MIRLLAATILLAGCAHTPRLSTNNAPGFFGVATLKSDGQICLHLRSEEPELPAAESYQCYKPDDPQYAIIRKHVGPLAVGEEKIIAPFK